MKEVGRTEGLALICFSLTMLLGQFPIALLELERDRLFNERVQVLLGDIPLAALIVVVAPRAVHEIRVRGLGRAASLWAVIAALVALSATAHPSPLSFQTTGRIVGTLAIAITIGTVLSPRTRVLAYATVAAVAAVQTAWALAQLIHGGPLGVPALGEFSDQLPTRGGIPVPHGTLGHEYVLVALGMLAASLGASEALRGSRRWAAAGLLAATVGFTFSRAALLAAALVAAPLAMASRRVAFARTVLAVIVLAIAVPAAVLSEGWVDRAAQTFGTPRPDDAATARDELARQALVLIAHDPVLGAGPGGYVRALRRTFPDVPVEKLEPVHDVPALAAAEAGVPAGLVAAAITALMLWRYARRGAAGRVITVVLVAPWLLDHFLWSQPQGLLLAGIWLGASDALDHT